MRLRTVIFGVYVAASAVGFAVLMAFLLWEVRPRYVESIRRTLQDTAGLVAGTLENRIRKLEEEPGAGVLAERWTDAFSELQSGAGSLRLSVSTRDGRVLFATPGEAEAPAGISWTSPLSYAHGDREESQRELRVSREVSWRGRVVALVRVERPLSSVQEWIANARWRILMAALAIAAAMVAAGWWVAQRVARSIERLTDYVETLRRSGQALPPESRALEIEQLSRAFEELRQALEGKAYVERYTQNLAHELKAPLTAIRGAAELLSENPPAEVRERFLSHLRAEVERIRLIVDRLLELAALENRTRPSETENLDLRRLAEDVCDEVRTSCQDAGVMLELRLPQTPVFVRAERWLVKQALANLVRNALDFSSQGGRVIVGVHADASGRVAECDTGIISGEIEARPIEEAATSARTTLYVEDEGTGVPDYALPRAFERFFSLPRPGTGRKSSGLGLSFVKEVARLHGGDARLENLPERGARASFTLRSVS